MSNEAVTLFIPGTKNPFVAGLLWRHESRRPTLRYIRSLAQSEGRYFATRRADKAWQIGFASFDADKKPQKVRHYSIASIIADARGGTWRGVWKVNDESYLYVAIRGGEIIPDGDLVGGRDDIMLARDAHSGFAWEHEVDGGITELLEILAHSKGNKKYGLFIDSRHPIDFMPYIFAASAIAVVAGVAWGAKYLYHERLDRERALALQLKRAELAKKNMVPPSWVDQPSPGVFISACEAQWVSQPLWVAGWKMSSWSCQQSDGGAKITVNVAWIRGGGAPVDAPGVFDKTSGGTASMETREKAIQWRRNMFDRRAPSEDFALKRIYGFSQSLGVGLLVDGSAHGALVPASLPGVSSAAAPSLGERSGGPKRHEFTTTSPWSPFMSGFGSALSGIEPELRVQEIRWDLSKWTVTGSFYTTGDH